MSAKNRKRGGLLYRKFQTGGPLAETAIVGHQQGQNIERPVRQINDERQVRDYIEQGVTDNQGVNGNYARIGDDTFYENKKMPDGTYFVGGKPQTVVDRFVPSPSGATPVSVPKTLSNRFKVGAVRNGVQTFSFSDQQFAGKYNRGQIQGLFLKQIAAQNPNLREVDIDGNIYRLR